MWKKWGHQPPCLWSETGGGVGSMKRRRSTHSVTGKDKTGSHQALWVLSWSTSCIIHLLFTGMSWEEFPGKQKYSGNDTYYCLQTGNHVETVPSSQQSVNLNPSNVFQTGEAVLIHSLNHHTCSGWPLIHPSNAVVGAAPLRQRSRPQSRHSSSIYGLHLPRWLSGDVTDNASVSFTK